MSVSDVAKKSSEDIHRIRKKYEAEGNPFSSMNIFNISKGTSKSNWAQPKVGVVNGSPTSINYSGAVSVIGLSKDISKGGTKVLGWNMRCPKCERVYPRGTKVIMTIAGQSGCPNCGTPLGYDAR